jgi:hypothetical protein
MLATRIEKLVEQLGCASTNAFPIGHSIHNDILWLCGVVMVLDLDSYDIGKAYKVQHTFSAVDLPSHDEPATTRMSLQLILRS